MRSAPVPIKKRIGNQMNPVRPKYASRLAVAVISRSSLDTNSEISEIRTCLEKEGREIVDLTFELDNFSQTERQHISSIIAINCVILVHLRYKSKGPLNGLENMNVPFMNQVRTLEFLLDEDKNVAYDKFILNHLKHTADQLETLSFGNINIGRCLKITSPCGKYVEDIRCRSLQQLQAQLNDDAYDFLEYHSNLEILKIRGPFCDMERLRQYLPIIKNLYISCNIIINIDTISKLRHLTYLEINCSHPDQTRTVLVNALASANFFENVIDFKVSRI